MSTNTVRPLYFDKSLFFKSVWDSLKVRKANEQFKIHNKYHTIYYTLPDDSDKNNPGIDIGPIILFLNQDSYRILDLQNGNLLTAYSGGRPTFINIENDKHGINNVCNFIFHAAIDVEKKTVRQYLMPTTTFVEDKKNGSVRSCEIIMSTTALYYEPNQQFDYHILFDNGLTFSRSHPNKADNASGHFTWEKA